jgi:hypothetical protein
MPRAKRLIESTVTIDGISLVWHLHREQQGNAAEGWRGMAIHVRVAEGVRRELNMEYPPIETQKTNFSKIGYSPRPNIVAAKVEAQIREAIAEGWDPESRGKPYVFHVAELPC